MKILINLFYIFTFIIFYIFIDEVLKLNYKPDYDSSLREIKYPYPVLVICFKLNLARNNCDFLDEKLEFNCSLKHQLGCLTKGWNNVRRNWIKNEIKKCVLERKILIYDNQTQIRPKYVIIKEEDKLCLRFDNEIFFNIYRSHYYYKLKKSFNQDFNIHFQKDKKHLLTKSLFHRKCFLINKTNYNCRNARIGFNSAQIIRKKNLNATRCIDYGLDKGYEIYQNYHDCIKSCFKQFKFNLTKEIKYNCSKYNCPYPDCKEYLFYFDNINEELYLKDDYNRINFYKQTMVTEVVDLINFDSLFKYIIGILSSLFGFNFLNQLLNLHSFLNEKFDNLLIKNSRKDQLKSLKFLIKKFNYYIKYLIFLITIIVCIYQMYQCVYKYLQFEIKRTFYYDFNVTMENQEFTLSICFNLNVILDYNKTNKNITDLTLKEINDYTLESNKLLESLTLSSAKIKLELFNYTEKRPYYLKDNNKCFDWDFVLQETKLDYYLRITQMNVKATKNFSSIYLRMKDYYPSFEMLEMVEEQISIYANIDLRQNEKFKTICKDYDYEIDRCFCKRSCIQFCQRDLYLKEFKNLTINSKLIITQNDILYNETFSKLKLDYFQNIDLLTKFHDKCELNYPLDDCFNYQFVTYDSNYGSSCKKLANTTKSTFQIFINTETNIFDFKFNFNDLIYSLINILSLMVGFNLKLIIDILIKLITKYLKIKLWLDILKFLFLLIAIILFLIHLNSFIELIKSNQKMIRMYIFESKSNYLPRFSICFKFNDHLANITGLTAFEILNQTYSIDTLISELKFYDSEFNMITINRTNLLNYTYYGNNFLNSKDYKLENRTKLDQFFRIKPFLIQKSKCFEFIITFKYKLIDYRIKRITNLLTMIPDFNNKTFNCVLIIISNLNRFNLENWHRFSVNEQLEINYKRLKTIYNDNLFYFKNPLNLIKNKPRLNQQIYFDSLQEKFYYKFNRTTTIIPLHNLTYFNAKIDNELFKKFYQNISNDESYLDEKYSRLSNHFTAHLFVELIKLIDKNSELTLFKFHPTFLKYNLIVTNRLTVVELILFFTLIINLYLGVVFVELPSFIILNCKLIVNFLKIIFSICLEFDLLNFFKFYCSNLIRKCVCFKIK